MEDIITGYEFTIGADDFEALKYMLGGLDPEETCTITYRPNRNPEVEGHSGSYHLKFVVEQSVDLVEQPEFIGRIQN